MIKLKYLFDNRDLAEMIMKKWGDETGSVTLLEHYRISSNAVYPFEYAGQRYYLRFSPVEEHDYESLMAEIEYLQYLRAASYPVPELVYSRAGNDLERVGTPWGEYFAAVFREVPGKRLDRIMLNDDLIIAYGQALGTLHELSRKYRDYRHKRDSWHEHLDQAESILSAFPDEVEARIEIKLLRSCMQNIPVTQENFGLVHYDFELDNVFYDEETDRFHVIDFNDSMYHWYLVDIDQTIINLKERRIPNQTGDVNTLFFRGYNTKSSIDETLLPFLPVFRRYVDLVSYSGFLRVTAETWDNEPEWMLRLRKILHESMKERQRNFGKPTDCIPEIERYW